MIRWLLLGLARWISNGIDDFERGLIDSDEED